MRPLVTKERVKIEDDEIHAVSLRPNKIHPLGYKATCRLCPEWQTKIFAGSMSEREGYDLANAALIDHRRSPAHLDKLR